MKGESLRNFIIVVITSAIVLFIYVATLNEIKNLNKDKLTKVEQLNALNNKIETSVVQIQKLTSEDRITKFVIDSLGMKKSTTNIEVIIASKNQIRRLEKILQEKYDK
jgi:flagella basal body P-ring formation protein FlgA